MNFTQKITEAINVLRWKTIEWEVGETAKVVRNGRGDLFSWVNNQSSSSLQALHVGLSLDWSIRVWLNTYFALIKKNYVCASALRFLSMKVGWYWIYFVDSKWNTVKVGDDQKARVEEFFKIPTLRSYIYKSIAYYIVGWQKIVTASLLNKFNRGTPGSKVNVLDPRMLMIKIDKETGEVIKYEYWNNFKKIELMPEQVVDTIVYPDLDKNGYGQSQMDSIVIEWLTDYVAWSRQFHFYRNNATPGTVYLLDSEVVKSADQVQELEKKINEKFWGGSNTGKPLASTAIKDVKTIEIPDIKLIDDRELILKIITMVFGIDPRVLGYMKETWGSYAEIDAIARNMTNAKLEEWTNMIEESMNAEYAQFMWELPYKIKLDTIYFKNIENDKKTALEEVKAGIITADDYKSLFNM